MGRVQGTASLLLLLFELRQRGACSHPAACPLQRCRCLAVLFPSSSPPAPHAARYRSAPPPAAWRALQRASDGMEVGRKASVTCQAEGRERPAEIGGAGLRCRLQAVARPRTAPASSSARPANGSSLWLSDRANCCCMPGAASWPSTAAAAASFSRTRRCCSRSSSATAAATAAAAGLAWTLALPPPLPSAGALPPPFFAFFPFFQTCHHFFFLDLGGRMSVLSAVKAAESRTPHSDRSPMCRWHTCEQQGVGGRWESRGQACGRCCPACPAFPAACRAHVGTAPAEAHPLQQQETKDTARHCSTCSMHAQQGSGRAVRPQRSWQHPLAA